MSAPKPERLRSFREEMESCERLKRELKRRALVWQSEARERLAVEHGLALDAYFDLTFDEWNELWAGSRPDPLVTVEQVVFRGEVLCPSYLQTLAYSLNEAGFTDALSLLYSRDSRRGRTGSAFDLYALFCEIDWPEGYYYCMESTNEVRRLRGDLLRRPQNGVRYKAGRWRSRGYTAKKLDEQHASPGRYSMARRKRPYSLRQTSPFRGVWWDRHSGKFRAEIEVRGRRYRLSKWHDDRDAALAYDAAAEALGVPERRNFGAHPVYDELRLLRSRMRRCGHCRGAGQIGGEFHPPGVAGSHGRFVRLGRWRQCEKCAGAGYFVDGKPPHFTEMES